MIKRFMVKDEFWLGLRSQPNDQLVRGLKNELAGCKDNSKKPAGSQAAVGGALRPMDGLSKQAKAAGEPLEGK
jgi:hypothetical protein